MAYTELNNESHLEDIIDDLIGCMAVKDLKEAHQQTLYALMQGKAYVKYSSKQKKQIAEYFALLTDMFDRLEPYEKKRYDTFVDRKS